MNKKLKYTIEFPIGDWSDDGHGKCEYFLVKSNKPVEEVREIHFNSKVDIGSICSECDESELKDYEHNKLIELGYEYEDKSCEKYKMIFPKEMLRIWMFLLMYSDKDLKLELIEEEYSTINFYGYNEDGKHLETPGYGLF